MNLNDLNYQTKAQASHTFMQCCTSSTWVETMVKARPFSDSRAVINQADLAWQESTEADYMEAFEGHPKIGDVSSLRAKYGSTKELAGNEQGLVKKANDDVLEVLSRGNSDYEAKFGFIFIVCATGKALNKCLIYYIHVYPITKRKSSLMLLKSNVKYFNFVSLKPSEHH
jgi:2-oxo-4-hydroxy-4-carboxy-5-ureidoimidazoline decarboxylase